MNIWKNRSPYMRLPPAPDGHWEKLTPDGCWLLPTDPDPLNPPPGVIDSRRRPTKPGDWRAWLWPRSMLAIAVERRDEAVTVMYGDGKHMTLRAENDMWLCPYDKKSYLTIEEALVPMVLRLVTVPTTMELMEFSLSLAKPRKCEYCKKGPQTFVTVAGRRACRKCLRGMGLHDSISTSR